MKCVLDEYINENECLVSSGIVSLLSMHGDDVEIKLLEDKIYECEKVKICFCYSLPSIIPTIFEIRNFLLDIPIHNEYQYLIENESYSVMIKILSINNESDNLYYFVNESTEISLEDLDKEDEEYVSLFLENSVFIIYINFILMLI